MLLSPAKEMLNCAIFITDDHKLLTYHLSANKMEVVDIPPGYLHCIENTGTQDMVVIIWANEVFDETYPDTYYKEV